MKQFLGLWIFYCIFVALLLPLLITFFCGGFGKKMPKTAEIQSHKLLSLQEMQEKRMDLTQYEVIGKDGLIKMRLEKTE